MRVKNPISMGKYCKGVNGIDKSENHLRRIGGGSAVDISENSLEIRRGLLREKDPVNGRHGGSFWKVFGQKLRLELFPWPNFATISLSFSFFDGRQCFLIERRRGIDH